jgi:uncharacterized protein (UPF0332 family)
MMNQPTAIAWKHAADASLEVAVLLFTTGKFDSAASRAYYAAYSAVHALAFSAGMAVEGQHAPNNWEHARVVHVLWQAAGKTGVSVYQRNILAQYLKACQQRRVFADYVPGTLDRDSVQKSLQSATAIVRFAGGSFQ